MSTTRSFSSGRPLMASTRISSGRSFTSTLQARRFTPLMRMASEPHTPWAQERRKVREPSRFHLT